MRVLQLQASYTSGWLPEVPQASWDLFQSYDSYWTSASFSSRCQLLLAHFLTSWWMRGGCRALLTQLMRLTSLILVLILLWSPRHPPSMRDDVRFWTPGSLPVTLTTQLPLPTLPKRSSFGHKQYGIRSHLRYHLETTRKAHPPIPRPQRPLQLMATTIQPEKRYHFDWKSFDEHIQAKRLDHELGYDGCFIMPTYLKLTIPSFILDELIGKSDPAGLFRQEKMLLQADFLARNDAAVVQAHMATIDLLDGLGISVTKTPHSNLSEAYLSNNDNSELPIVFDTGCSLSVTPYEGDFITALEEPDVDVMKGLSDTVAIKGVGMVQWTVRDYHGIVGTIITRAYLVPQASIRLFSPQTYFKENEGKGTEAKMNENGISVRTASDDLMFFPYNCCNNLPIMLPDWTDSHPHLDDVDVHGLVEQVDQVNQILDDQNLNLTKEEKELLLWHQRLGHVGFTWLQTLMRPTKYESGAPPDPPTIPVKLKGASKCTPPKCVACSLAKQHRKTSGSSSTHHKPEREMAIRRNNLQPGECVSIDQYVCRTPGRLANTFGKEHDSMRYTGGTIFVDHATGFTFTRHQISLRIGETLQAKHEFEALMGQFGIRVQAYRADNHPFGKPTFVRDCDIQNQTLTFSGVGAHFQNGVAERALQTNTNWARAMMMHQLIHWPEQFNPELWPFALEHATHIWNSTPKQGSPFAPWELLTKTRRMGPSPLENARVWGCAVYVLDPKLQDGKKLPKWTMRSRQGVYLGISPVHASTVGRILNITTGAVTPQYHVMYDEYFTTVTGKATDAIFDSELWNTLLSRDGLENTADPMDFEGEITPFQEFFDDFVDLTDDDSETSSDSEESSISSDSSEEDDFGSSDPQPSRSAPPSRGTHVPRGEGKSPSLADALPHENSPFYDIDSILSHRTRSKRLEVLVKWSGYDEPTWEPATVISADVPDLMIEYAIENSLIDNPKWQWIKDLHLANRRTLTSTHRQRQPKLATRSPAKLTSKLVGTYAGFKLLQGTRQQCAAHLTVPQVKRYRAGGNPNRKIRCEALTNQYLSQLRWDPREENWKSYSQRQVLIQLQHDFDAMTGLQEDFTPLALAAKSNDPDTLDWFEAMNSPEREGFMEAARAELETLEDMDVWEVVPKESWMNVLPGTWAFRRKRLPSGEIKKLKARYCARGDRQLKDVDFFETFAPVVSWNTVRLLLTLQAQLGLANSQVDFTAAFVHADIDLPPDYDMMSPEEKEKVGVFVEMPRGFAQPGMVLRLKKSLYGLRQAPRNHFQNCRDSLEAIGFKQAINVDPCLFISDKVICLVYVDDCLFFAKDQADIDLAIERLKGHFKLEVEDEVGGFLGVHIERNDKNQVILTQKGLIKRILEQLNVADLPAVDTPANVILGKDEDGDPPECTFNYASVIGSLWYVYGHSRPDLGFALSQCSRFTFAPKRSHELALIRIGQYLKGTADKGMIMKPGSPDKIQMDVYVDSDFMGLYGKEQRHDSTNVKSRAGHIILINGCPIIWSSKLQDCIALSTMMAEYYALSSAMREVLPLRELVHTVAKGCGIAEACTTSFLTTVFEDNNGALTLANLDPGHQTPRSKHYDVRVHWFRSHLNKEIKVVKVDTALQLADLFTKPLPREQFQKLRKLLIGW